MWTGGGNYESYIGRWSRLVARQFVPWLNVPSGAQWLDVGCGTGTLIQTMLDTVSPQLCWELTLQKDILILLAR